MTGHGADKYLTRDAGPKTTHSVVFSASPRKARARGPYIVGQGRGYGFLSLNGANTRAQTYIIWDNTNSRQKLTSQAASIASTVQSQSILTELSQNGQKV